jgi:DNA replication and repair protein RecF
MTPVDYTSVTMVVEKISVNGLRSYSLYSAELHPEVTLIIGKNGTGKTTLLEAIYFMHRGTSFRGRDRDIIPYETMSAEIKIDFNNNETRKAQIILEPEGKVSKQFHTNGAKTARLGAKYKLPVVLFEPDELRLLTSSPSRRRDFLDGIIARLSPTYSTVLSRFSRSLAQRNELLKQFDSMKRDIWESHLFAWDVKLAELGATIIKTRINFIEHANKQLSRIYSQLAGSKHTLLAEYLSELSNTQTDSLQQHILAHLESHRQSDGLRGYTSIGPHRDDFTLTLNAHSASETASRGEMRTIMLAFKLLEVELQEHHSGQKPLILLDDVFSELDADREVQLIDSLKNYQTIITATDLRDTFNKTNTTILSL